MNAVQVWLSIAGVILATLLARTVLLFLGPTLPLNPRLAAALHYAPACALAAVIAPDLLFNHGTFAPSLGNPRLVAGLAGVAVFLASRSTVVTIVGGMAGYWIVRLIHGS